MEKRTILFKGKCLKSNEWVFGNLVRKRGNQEEFTTAIQVLDENQEVVSVRNIHPETVCQFTGLTDKNGVKIFEGDKILHKPNENIKYVFIVKFTDNAFNCYYGNIIDPNGNQSKWGGLWTFNELSMDIEVIGNIHTT